MSDLLKLLQDALGARVIVPVVIILLTGYLFTYVRGYPARELLYDRWYLISVVAVVSLTVVFVILNSGLAERTPEGRLGVYIARFNGDDDRSLHTRLTEAMIANLSAKAAVSKTPTIVRDLKVSLSESDVDDISERARKLNAAAIIWGSAIDKSTIYIRVWTRDQGLTREVKPLDISEITKIADLTTRIWNSVRAQGGSSETEGKKELAVAKEIVALKHEVAELRDLVTATLATASVQTGPISASTYAVLVGVSDYGFDVPSLRGPRNDVKAMAELMAKRRKEWKVSALVDSGATRASILEAIIGAATALGADDLLFVYLSGHSFVDEQKKDYFLPYDAKATSIETSGLKIEELLLKTLNIHKRVVFVLDAAFNPKDFDRNLLSDAAILIDG